MVTPQSMLCLLHSRFELIQHHAFFSVVNSDWLPFFALVSAQLGDPNQRASLHLLSSKVLGTSNLTGADFE